MSYRKNRNSIGNIISPKNKSLYTPNRHTQLNKTFQLNKLKTLLSINDAKIKEIKGRRQHFSSFHLINENDKYKAIEKKIQNKILNISMLILKDTKFDSDITGTVKPFKPKIKSNKNLEFNSFKIAKANKSTHIHRPSMRLPRPSLFLSNLAHFKEIVNEKNRKIKRIHNLYDSFGEDESDKDIEKSNYGLNPRSIFIDSYDMLMLISASFCLFYIPYRLARTKMIINNNEHFVLFMIYFSEIIFIIDLIFGFFRWFYNNEFKLVSNKYMIITNYLYGDFFFDLIMAIPFYSIFKFKNYEKSQFDSIYNESHFVLKILICFKAFKIFKVNKDKNNRVVYFFNRKFAKNYYIERVYQITNFVIIILSVFNLFISFHIYMAQLSFPNWIFSSNLQDKKFIDIYLSSLYFIMATLTSVGYGDIVCVNFEETCFQIVLLSIGLVAYSWIISTVGDYVKNKSRATMNFNRDMTKLEEIRIAYPNMPFKLYNKIQQHIQRLLTQSKKYEYNILVNSLPYYLQNSVLFQIHKNEISKFTFFKDCDNSDFILKVLTHFIPIFSKKNIVLVGEGEFFENIFFIKEGRLALEAIIDLDNIEMSIEKYLKYRFEEIEEIEDISENENSIQKSTIMERSYKKHKKIKTKHFLEMINKQFENIEENANIHESNIEQEIGKCDFHLENQDLYKGDIQYIHILDLLKNEYFGEILMFLNIPNPLSLKVKSKRVELYVLRKKDAFYIKKDYQNIWQRLNKKSIHNIKSLKSLTLDIINRYCEMNGIIIKEGKIIKSKASKHISSYNKTFKNNAKQISSKFNSKTMATSKLDFDKNKMLANFKSSLKVNFKENKKDKVKFKQKSTLKQTHINKFNLSFDKNDKNESDTKVKRIKSKSAESNKKSKQSQKKVTESSGYTSSSSISFSLSEKTLNNKINKQASLLAKNKVGNNKSQIIKNKNENKRYSIKKISKKKFGPLSAYNSISPKNLYRNSIITNNKSHKNNISNNHIFITGISMINKFNSSESNNVEYLTQESNISLQILSSYKNINELSEGIYIKAKKLQDLINKIVKYYIKTNSIENEKKYIQKFFSDNNEIKINNSNISNLSNNNSCYENPSVFSEKNSNSIKYQSQNKYSTFIKDKFLLLNYSKNKFIYNDNSKEIIYPMIKNKYILDQSESKSMSMNSLNQLNQNNNNKMKKLYSKFKNIKPKEIISNNYSFKYKKYETYEKSKSKDSKMNKINKKQIKEKPPENLYSNNIINNKNGNSIHEVNLNYVNNFCCIY